MKIVITGDNQWEKEQAIETRKVDYGGQYRDFIGDTEFDGHHTLWGYEYFPTTYLKSSELSGDEWRKGGEIRYFKDRKQCYSEFCREPLIAANKIGGTLLKLMDFDWERLKEGRKIYWRETSAVIGYIMPEQGCFMVKVDGAERFPDHVWQTEEEGFKLENPQEVKISIFDPHIWWYRK